MTLSEVITGIGRVLQTFATRLAEFVVSGDPLMKEKYNREKHDDKVIELLDQIERHLASSEKKPVSFLGVVEKVTPFMATVVLGGVTAYLTYSINLSGERTKQAQLDFSRQQSAAQLALSKQQF